jgi:hypothetical protein
MSGPCDGCLDDRQCWVCLGSGKLETSHGQRRPCQACGGTGYCGYCSAGPDPRVQVIYAADRDRP